MRIRGSTPWSTARSRSSSPPPSGPTSATAFTILNSSAVNAFALPSGHLYVTRGLIALANDTSELASVLSHEMAHVIAQHAAMREDRARQVALVGRVFDNFGADPDTHALALAKSKIALATFSRSQELEADGIGVGIAARAGYDPFGAVRFLSSLGRQAELRPPGQSAAAADTRMPDFLSSHPATPERVRNAQINARQFSGPGGGNRDREAYLAGIDGMLYGEDPSEGYVRGRRFLHPRLGFTFMAPDGFALDNTPQAVLGIKDGGGQALRLDVVRVAAEQPLPAYLNSGWIENIDGSTVEELTIGGFPAATALAARRPMGVPAVRDPVRQRCLPLHLRDQADDAGERSRVPRGGRHLPPHERRRGRLHQAAAHPVVQVGEGDTVERLAGRMATDRKEERFRILNGLGPVRPRARGRAGEDRDGVKRPRALPSRHPAHVGVIMHVERTCADARPRQAGHDG